MDVVYLAAAAALVLAIVGLAWGCQGLQRGGKS